MKEYYYVSEGIVRQFPEFEKSKEFEGPFGVNCHIAVIPDFGVVEKFVNEDETDTVLFANQCVDSQVSLTYDSVDYDDDDNEIEVATELTIEVCKDWGLEECRLRDLPVSEEIRHNSNRIS